ncbi:MAG: hypothetical protein J7J93_02935 [Candidatus Aenigmarchaeota archaeon]|nr:hypothetical protein [Candidatus Aenigmarchaeota archaeon]
MGNKYWIEHKIKTLAELWDEEKPSETEQFSFTYQNYEFTPWNFSSSEGHIEHAWLARGEVTAGNVVDAINKYRKKLSSISDKIGFVSQCYTAMELEPFMVIKKNNNPENKFLLRYTKSVKGVPLYFVKKQIDSLKNLENYNKEFVFKYINESTRAGTYYTRLAMLVIALESIAGEERDNRGNLHTDKSYIKNEILKDENLYREIFNYETGIRNKLFHGKEVEFNEDYATKIYQRIVEYFNSNYGTKIDTKVTYPQRIFFGNYSDRFIWLKPKTNDLQLDFRSILKMFDKYQKKRDKENNEFLQKFSLISPVKDY